MDKMPGIRETAVRGLGSINATPAAPRPAASESAGLTSNGKPTASHPGGIRWSGRQRFGMFCSDERVVTWLV